MKTIYDKLPYDKLYSHLGCMVTVNEQNLETALSEWASLFATVQFLF